MQHKMTCISSTLARHIAVSRKRVVTNILMAQFFVLTLHTVCDAHQCMQMNGNP